jgi:hypothetical protein
LPSRRRRWMWSRVGAWQRARVTMTRCSAALIWRLPPWSSRWRWVLPELAGIGATPAARASLAAVAKRCAPAISPTSLAAIGGPTPRLVKQLRRDLLDALGDLAFEPVDRERELARPRQLIARDANAHRLLGAGESPADPRAPLGREQRAARQLKLGPQIVQMPLPRAVEFDALADEAFAVVDEQPQIELGTIQVRHRERLQALLQRGAGSVERVDRVRLPTPPGALARLRGQVRRDPQPALAARDHKPLERPADVTAVLKRPHAVLIDAARPVQQRRTPRADRDGLLAEQPAGHRRDRRIVCERL